MLPDTETVELSLMGDSRAECPVDSEESQAVTQAVSQEDMAASPAASLRVFPVDSPAAVCPRVCPADIPAASPEDMVVISLRVCPVDTPAESREDMAVSPAASLRVFPVDSPAAVTPRVCPVDIPAECLLSDLLHPWEAVLLQDTEAETAGPAATAGKYNEAGRQVM